MMMNINDMQLRNYIDQVFLRYDYNGSGNLNLGELHNFLNEIFMMSGFPRTVSYQEAYQALYAMDSNRDGQVNRWELFNLFRYMTQPGYQPIRSYTTTTVTTRPVGFGIQAGPQFGVMNGGFGGIGNGFDPSWNPNNTGYGGW